MDLFVAAFKLQVSRPLQPTRPILDKKEMVCVAVLRSVDGPLQLRLVC